MLGRGRESARELNRMRLGKHGNRYGKQGERLQILRTIRIAERGE